MKFKHVVIEAMAYQDPESFLSSSDFESKLAPVYKRLKLPEGRLELQTGIQSRGYWEPGTAPSAISSAAAAKALEISKVKKEDIGLLIHTSVCRDFLEPSTASVIHNKLGLNPKCMSFDLSNACLGFVSGILMASEMIESGSIQSALIVTGENSGPLIAETIQMLNSNMDLTRKTIKKFIANLTIGSAGVAYVLTHDSIAPEGHYILGGESLSDTTSASLCQGDGNTNGLMMETESEELLHAGVKLAKQTWLNMKETLQIKNEDVDHVICHQVGVAHRDLMFKSLKLNLKLDYTTFDKYGNTGSAALPLTLIKSTENREYKKGDIVSLLGIGSGLHSVMLGVKW